jgi:hypothetical protein
MQFYHNNTLITIQGFNPNTIAQATAHQLNRMLQTNVIDTFHSISMIPTKPTTTTDSSTDLFTDEQFLLTVHPDLQTLLKQYSHVFAKLNNLPPPRDHDHHIHLTPTGTPINIKPYRYPHYQKEAMTQLITEMLHDGIIQPSTRPYSSPVLLVKKKVALGVFV